jgi:hypothetical protein
VNIGHSLDEFQSLGQCLGEVAAVHFDKTRQAMIGCDFAAFAHDLNNFINRRKNACRLHEKEIGAQPDRALDVVAHIGHTVGPVSHDEPQVVVLECFGRLGAV